MKRNFKLYWKLFTSTFYLSALTFGGGCDCTLMRKKFVEELKWIEEKEMLDMTAITQSSPGAMQSMLQSSSVTALGNHSEHISVFGTIYRPSLFSL